MEGEVDSRKLSNDRQSAGFGHDDAAECGGVRGDGDRVEWSGGVDARDHERISRVGGGKTRRMSAAI